MDVSNVPQLFMFPYLSAKYGYRRLYLAGMV